MENLLTGFTPLELLLLGLAVILPTLAGSYLQRAFRQYNEVQGAYGRTGREVARYILDAHGLQHVQIEHINGQLTDHYDPRANVVRLSDAVDTETSLVAISVAAHEVGHAIQYAKGYFPIKLRTMIFPVASIASQFSFPLFLAGILLSFPILMYIGILLFSGALLFQIFTLPVEFDASRRALIEIESRNLVSKEEHTIAKKVLKAAALTYVAGTLSTLFQLLRLVLIANQRNN